MWFVSYIKPMMLYQISYFEDNNGEAPFVRWLSSLKDRKAAALIKTRIDRLRFGLFGDSKVLREDVHELRIHFGPGYRLYFTKHQNSMVVLLCGGDKSTQRKDINKAVLYRRLLKDVDDAKTSPI
jgi:putative addiction module killer protein